MTVVASAVGPLFLAVWVERTGSYAAAFYVLAVHRRRAWRRRCGRVDSCRRTTSSAAIASRLPRGRSSSRSTRTRHRRSSTFERREEFSQGHVPGAINIPFQSIGRRVDAIPGSRQDPVVVYCGHGPRAWMAGAVLRMTWVHERELSRRALQQVASGWASRGTVDPIGQRSKVKGQRCK